MFKIRAFVGRYQLISFFLLTYLITWGLWIPFVGPATQEDSTIAEILGMWGVFGPALAGIIVTRVSTSGDDESKHKKPKLAFFLSLVLSALVLLLMISRNDGQSWTIGRAVTLFLLSCFVALPPAYIISSAFSRNQVVKGYLSSLIKPRGSIAYYLIALLLYPFIYWLGNLLSGALGQIPYYTPQPLNGWDAVTAISITFLYQFFYGNVLGEEVGWRGFALPRLQTKQSPFVASLIIALIWSLWHLPLWLGNPDDIPFLYHVVSFIPSSILLTWIYNRTYGGILAVGVAHVMNNVCGQILFPITDGRLIIGFAIAAMFVVVDRMWKNRMMPMDGKGEHQTVRMEKRFQKG